MDILLVILSVIISFGAVSGVFCDHRAAGGVFGFVAVAFTGYAEFTFWLQVGRVGIAGPCWHRRWTMLRFMLGTKYSGGSSGEIGDVPWEPWPVCSVFPPWGSYWVLSWGLSWELLGGKASGDALKSWFRGVRWFFIECRAEGYPLRLFYL